MESASRNRLPLSAVLSSFFVAVSISNASAAVTWTGTGNWWSSPGNWSSGSPPNSFGTDVIIGGSNSDVNLDNSANVGSLTINAGDRLDDVSGYTLTVNGGLITDNGTLMVRSLSNSNSALWLDSSTLLCAAYEMFNDF
ncbi:MAG: hypothetical protein WB421_00220 [Terriglobales bacterium]